MRVRRTLLKMAAVIALLPSVAWAQAYPSKPVRIINPFSAGGTSDILARLVATGLQASTGQPFIVESRPGAGGNVGMEATARSAPDGYTLVMVPSAITVATSLFKNLGYHPTKDLTPVALVGKAPSLLVVPAQSPFRSLEDMVKYARENPGKLNYASFGVGTSPHLIMELYLSKLGVKMTHIPYKGAGPVVADLMGGQVDLAFQTAAAVAPNVLQGKLRALATSSKERFPALPDVPAVAERGVPGFDESAWFGLVAPAGTPTAIIEKLNAETNRILQSIEGRKQLDALGVLGSPMSVEAFAAFMRSEETKWTAVTKAVGVKPE